MNCLRCGKECAGEQIFCKSCLKIMAAHPVSQDTPVVIYPRKALAVDKSRRKSISPAETIRSLQNALRRLWWLAAVLTVVIAMLCGLLYHALRWEIPELPQTPSADVSHETF